MLEVSLFDYIVQVLLTSITGCHPHSSGNLPCVLIMFPSGSIYIENKIGPSTEPCGAPWLTLVCTDDSSLICTNWNQSEKYDWNQFRAVPLMLINCSSLCNKMSWSIVLNAALRSNRMRTDTNPWSEAIRRSLVTLAKAVSMLWLGLGF